MPVYRQPTLCYRRSRAESANGFSSEGPFPLSGRHRGGRKAAAGPGRRGCGTAPGEDELVRTVELVCDDALDGAVRAVWRQLAAAGLPSLQTHPHPTNRPHLTVATAGELPPLAAALARLPIAVRLQGLVFFDGRAGMVAWRVLPDEALLRLHTDVWHALDGLERNPQHAPGAWVPHVSLARRVAPEQRAAVSDLVGGAVAEGRLVAARSYDTATRTVTALSHRRGTLRG